jgi:tight adherence protein C
MELAAIVLVFLAVAAVTTAAGYAIYVRPGRLRENLANVIGGGPAAAPPLTTPERSRKPAEWLSEIGKLLPVSSQDAGMAGRYLVAAGYRNPALVHVYLGTKVVVCAGLLAAAFTVRDYIPGANVVLRHVVIAGAALAGFMIPNFVLERMVQRRQKRIRLSIPDALDLLVVCVEAGLGLDQAIVNVTRQLQQTFPDLSEELSLTTAEMRAGNRRADALRNLGSRTGENDLRKLVAVLIQADRFGTSIADSLRAHSEFMRVRRKQIAEEKAAKMGVKLVFPIFFFIMPAMMVVSVGPGLLQLFRNLIPMMRSMK